MQWHHAAWTMRAACRVRTADFPSKVVLVESGAQSAAADPH